MTRSDGVAKQAPSLSRRDLITGGVALAAGYAASAIAPQAAVAANGDYLNVGTARFGSTGTMVVRSTDGTGAGTYQNYVILGGDSGGVGSPQRAVAGYSIYTAPHGSAGVWGSTNSPNQFGVQAANEAVGGTAMRAVAPDSGVGVNTSAPVGATALSVDGRAAFSRSGTAAVSRKKRTATVTVPGGLASNALVLATLRNAGSGVYLACATRINSTQFKVTLSKKAPKKTYFAWFIVG